MKTYIVVGLVGLYLLAPDARANPPALLETCHKSLVGSICDRRFFIVDKGDAPVFDSADTELPRVALPATAPAGAECVQDATPSSTPSLGEVFFAQAESNERVLVGHVSAECPWAPVGWMRLGDLLENQTSALTIGEFKQLQAQHAGAAFKVRFSQDLGGLSGQEYRLLRLVNHPERGSRLGMRPGDASGDPVFAWRWYYVYDVEVLNGQPWVLVGDKPELIGSARFEDTTKRDGAKKNLLGWLPVDNVAVWASNLVLELNTEPSAVAHRVRERAPAVVQCMIPGTDGQLLQGVWAKCKSEGMLAEDHAWTEQLDDMWTADGTSSSKEYKPILNVDPSGLNPSVPRLHIVQSWEGDYLEIVSSAATGGAVLSDVSYLMMDVSKAAKDLRKVDIVFVVDSTGSMKDEIVAVSAFLQRITDQLHTHTSGARRQVEVLRGRKLDLLGGLDISVGLVGFQDISGANRDYGKGCPPRGRSYEARTFFSGKRLNSKQDMADVRASLAALRSQLSGSCEALHEGLLEALGPKHFRDGTLDRMIILVADEPGNSRRVQEVLAAMPIPTKEQLEVGQLSKWQALNEVELKREMTTIFAIYVGEKGYHHFEQKVGLLVSERNLRRFGPVDQTQAQAFIGLLDDRLERKKRAIANELSVFRMKLRHSGQVEFDALPGLGQFKIREAMARANLTPTRLSELNAVAFFDGFVHLSDVEESGIASPSAQLGDTHVVERPAPWRLRVLVNRHELMLLGRNVHDVVQKLERALVETKEWLGRKSRTETHRELVARLIVLIVARTIHGEDYFSGDDGSKLLEVLVDEFLARFDSGHPDMDEQLYSVMKLQAHLPIRTDGGLLSLTLAEAAAKTHGWYLDQLHILRAKAKGLTNILNGLSIPEEPYKVETTDTVDKFWFHRLGTSISEFTYVPLSYLP